MQYKTSHENDERSCPATYTKMSCSIKWLAMKWKNKQQQLYKDSMEHLYPTSTGPRLQSSSGSKWKPLVDVH